MGRGVLRRLSGRILGGLSGRVLRRLGRRVLRGLGGRILGRSSRVAGLSWLIVSSPRKGNGDPSFSWALASREPVVLHPADKRLVHGHRE